MKKISFISLILIFSLMIIPTESSMEKTNTFEFGGGTFGGGGAGGNW